jgi:hypothetical protein
MEQVSNRILLMRLYLLGAISIALAIGIFLEKTTTAWDRLPQESPLSPLEPQIDPAAPALEEDTALQLAEATAAPALPLGEPLKAQTSLYLVGFVLAGLLGVVILIVVRQQRT